MRTTSALIVVLLAALAAGREAAAQVVIRAARVHTMAREGRAAVIEDGVIVIRDGKIVAVGPAASTPIPDGFRVLEAAVATPGLVDARGTAGVSGIFNQAHDQDQLERSSPVQPELRAIDAYNPNDPLVAWLRSYGVTTLHTGHAPGELISGQTCIVKTAGRTAEEAVVVETATVAATVGPWAQKGGKESPGTRAKMIAMLRDELIKASEYVRKRDAAARGDAAPRPADADADAEAEPATDADGKPKDPAARSLRSEMLARVLAGEVPLLVTANRAQDIANVLRLKREFGLRIILDSGAEAYLMADELRAEGVAVVLHPTMFRMFGEMENMSLETASILREAGVRVAIQSGYESYVPKTRVVLFEAAIAAANGLSFEQALAAITIDAAEILGVSSRVGSLEPGKDGDVALYDGDPFEYTTHCVGVVIEGVVVSEVRR